MTYAMFYAGQQIGQGLSYAHMEGFCTAIDKAMEGGTGWLLMQHPHGDGIGEQRIHVGPSTPIAFLLED